MAILREAKRLAIAEGLAPAAAAQGMRAFQEKGQLTQIAVGQRQRLGLPPASRVATEELQALLGGESEHPAGEGRDDG
jgi:hypothetical protein